MTIISKDIPQTEKLLKIIPENVYTKDTPWLARQVVKINSDNQSGVSTTFPATNILKFTINPTTSNLINLAECYITMAGELIPYDDINLSLVNKGVPYSEMIIPPYWWINCIQKMTLYIGGTVVYDINNPMNLVNFYTSHFTSFTDRQNGNLEEKGIYSIIPDANNYILQGLTTTAGVSDTTPQFYNIQSYQSAEGDKLTFQNVIYLTDLFKGLDSVKPIYGNSIILEFTMESKGFTGIRGTNISSNHMNYCLINKFSQFNLNVVSYQLDSPMIEKLNQIYSKEIISVIDDIQYFNNSLMDVGENSTLEIKIPLNLKFSSDLINISIPQSTANNYNSYGPWSDTLAALNHTKLDNRLYPIQRISIYADGVLLYNRNYATSTVGTGVNAGENPLLISLNTVNTNEAFDLYDYTILYKEYKESRYCCYQNEHNAINIDEWLNDYFSINIPTSAFTKLSTSSNCIMQITFGKGIRKGTAGEIDSLTTIAGDKTVLTQIKVIQKSKKALVFKGFNTCEVRTIEQSFSNDITIDNLNDTQKTN